MRCSTTSFAVLLVAFGLAACGGDDAAPASSTSAAQSAAPAATGEVPDIDPCALVSQAEIERIIGMPVAALAPESPTPAGSLTYFSCRSDDLHIDIEAWSNAQEARRSFEFGHQYPAVEGLGFPATNTQPLGDLYALAGQFVVSVDLFTNQDQAAQLEAAKQLARLVVDRLPNP